ncbi:MAG: 5-(carboxyamino)imidazole ribonucleotide mutase [Bdellovibrionales bacterium]|jgi:5-(carboxyamino)imidazole ribonucleotide mutase|nr:5-(carboxyamino)imidazole ribonucleotide mutase [Bdellovibrionales bacterium]
MAKKASQPLVGIVMGSDSDWPVMKAAHDALTDFDLSHEVRVISAHRTPDEMLSYAAEAEERGLKVLIAGAGGAAHLPGMIASATNLPVIGVPVNITKLEGIDSFLSIVQMPRGVPVATVAIDNAANAGLLAVRILATGDASGKLSKKLTAYKKKSKAKVGKADARIKSETKKKAPKKT